MDNLREKVNDFLEENKLKYYKSNDEEDVYRILLPYRHKEIKSITLFMDVYWKINMLKLGFHEEVNKVNIDEVKTKLLDINGRLVIGTLSLEKDSDIVTYSIDWVVGEEDNILKETYNKNIVYSLNIYENLLKDNVIIQNKGI